MSNDGIFSRERLAGYEPERLARSAALIVGAGALGQNVAQNLALAGIGEMRIVDKDEFEPHNRTRSPAFPLPDEVARFGSRKAKVVAAKVARLMTAESSVMRHANSWIQELGDGAFKDVSVVLACVDNPQARAYLSDKCRLHGIPLVEGGFEGADITFSYYPAVQGDAAVTAPCWRCSHEEIAGAFSCDFYAAAVEKVGFTPAIQNAAATLAGLQCEAAIVALHKNMAASLECRAFDLNIRSGRSLVVQLSADPYCSGIHRSLDQQLIPLRTTAEQTVKELLLELEASLNESPTLVLGFPFIRSAPCKHCEQMTEVRSVSWAWEREPRCTNCGGSFRLETARQTDSPMVYTRFTLNSDSELLSLTCLQAGLPPLSLVETISGSNHTKVFELGGSINQLFETGDLNGQH
jgi:molybdopterin/thiamine biosynthesis adenylyltransferase